MIIGNRLVGLENKPFIIAEVAQTHEGSLGNALAFATIAKACGADAIKYQTHIAEEESTQTEPWRVHFSKQDQTRYDYWKRMQFSRDQWRELKTHADSLGLIFLSSPFSPLACDWLEELDMPAWKLASGEVHNVQLVDRISRSEKPIILSSGLSLVSETRALAQRLIKEGHEVAILHCTTQYPTRPQDEGLNVMQELASVSPVFGLSDHSGTIFPAVVASYLGASVIEVHITMHHSMFGPDVSSSLTPDEFVSLVKGVEFAWQMRQNPVIKEDQLSNLSRERKIFGRSLVAARPIAVGEVIDEGAIAYKKPGGGMSYEEKNLIIGKRAKVLLDRDTPFGTSDVE